MLQENVIPGYKVCSLIGRGAMGRVFEVESEDESHACRAIKIFEPVDQENQQVLKRQFDLEIAALQCISNPKSLIPKGVYLPRIYGKGTLPKPHNTPYYIMDCVKSSDGSIKNLSDIQNNALENWDLIEGGIEKWFFDVARTLAFIHKHNIIHGDIKPENIVVDSRNHAFLVDFGAVATSIQHSDIGIKRALEGDGLLKHILLGSDDFKAPEVRDHLPPITKSDVYSLGATFWQLLFDERIGMSTDIEQIINDDIHKSLLPNEKWKKLLPKMLEKSPDKRVNADKCIAILEGSQSRCNLKVDTGSRTSRFLEECDKTIFECQYRQILVALDDYARLVTGLEWCAGGRTHKGEDVFRELYKKHRKPELRVIKDYLSKHQFSFGDSGLIVELSSLDAIFMKDFESAGLSPLADILFQRLNALWASFCIDSAYTEAHKFLMEKGVSISRNYLSPAAQFIFGKYRHLKWDLDSDRYFHEGKRSAEYRGERAADRLFMYERTLMAYKPSPDVAKMQEYSIAERNKIEGLDKTEIIDLPAIWQS